MQQKRRSFSAVDFGEALCKRFRSTRFSLLARIESGSGNETPTQLSQLCSASESATSQSLATRFYLPPDELQADPLRALPPAVPRLSAQAPVGGKIELWEISRTLRETPVQRRAESRSQPLGYLEYLSWLQRVLPECMLPEAQKLAEEGGTEYEGDKEDLSALDLLRRLSVAALPPKRSRVPPLTAEELELADTSLDSGDGSEILVSRFNVELTRKQLSCLHPGQWLNDEVINFYCKLLEERGKKSNGFPKCWFPNSFFWPKLSGENNKYSYKDVKRWTIKSKIDIFELDYIIFPMNIGASHWALGAIDRKEHGFRYFDSMFSMPHKNFVPFLQQYLKDEHQAKKGKPLEGIEDWDLIMPDPPLPQQNNGYDCGVFTCCFADCFSAGRGCAFEQDDMPNLRLRIAARVVSGKEDWAPI